MPAAATLVHQQSTGTGSGNLTLLAVNGRQSFDTAFGHGATTNVFDYFISNQGAAEWERGTGHMSDATTLVRDTVLESTNAGSAVSFSIGTKDVTNDVPPAAQVIITNCGILQFSSATALTFTPYNGDRIRINGVVYAIPSGGITGLANTSVFVNGVGASNLAASTLYHVYAFNNAGTITADFSTTTHATSSTAGNVGTEVKSGDDTRTLIGLIRTNASSQFADSLTQRFVRSWFNRVGISGTSGFSTDKTTTSATVVELGTEIRVEFVVWTGELVEVGANVICYGAAFALAGCVSAIAFDGTTPEEAYVQAQETSNNQPYIGVTIFCAKGGLAEGYHYVTLLGGSSGSNTGTWRGVATGQTAIGSMVRTTLWLGI